MLEHISKFIFRVKYQEQKLCEDIDNKEKNSERTIKKLQMTIEYSLFTWFDIYKYTNIMFFYKQVNHLIRKYMSHIFPVDVFLIHVSI